MENKRTRDAQKKRRLSRIITGTVIVLLLAGTAVFGYNYLYIREINVYGNRHLTNAELTSLIGCDRNSRLFSVSTGDIYRRLKASPWIKDALVRKDLTGKVTVQITETVAVAVLQTGDKPYLVEREGVRLEEIRQEQAYFLPLIKIDPSVNKDAYQEAVVLAGILYERKMMSQGGNIEITGTRPEDITMRVDSISVKMGTGDFTKKLERLSFVRDEIGRRNMAVEYVDLRFADKIVVRPLKQENRETSRRTASEKGRNGAAGKDKKNAKLKKNAKKATGGKTKEYAG